MKVKFLIFFLLVSFLLGCASVDITKTAKGFYDKTDPNDIEILKMRPNRSYIELGTVTATGFNPNDTAKMHNAIRTKSAQLGANAVILTDEGIITDGLGKTRWAIGVAIRYE